jgi:hypothetical protein
MGLAGGGREHPDALRGVRECARLDVLGGFVIYVDPENVLVI